MSYDDERQHLDGEAHLVMSTGSGKTLSMIAYWHLMQTPVEGEEEPGGTVDERFTPVSDEALERRLAALDELTVRPLPPEIECLSNSGRFLIGPEADDAGGLESKQNVHSSPSEKGSQQGPPPKRIKGYHEAGSRTSTLKAWKCFAEQLRRPIQREETWQEARRGYSAVLYVRAGDSGIGTPEMKHTEKLPVSRSHRWDWLAHWADRTWVVNRHREYPGDAERSRARLRYLTYDSLSPYDEFLRDAVRTYFAPPVSIMVVVDSVGAARDPNAALNSLIAEATSFSAAEADDGAWTLLVTAPAVAGECSHTMERPRLAVLELPGDPPPEPQKLNSNAQSVKLLREIRNVLEEI